MCCWQQLLPICTVARGTVNWIITLRVVGVVVAKATLRHAIAIAWLHRRVVRCTADVTNFSYMTLMDKSAVKHNMLKVGNKFSERLYSFVTLGKIKQFKILFKEK